MPALCYFYMPFAIFILYLSDTCIEGEVIPTHYFSARFERNTNVVYCPKISCLIASIVYQNLQIHMKMAIHLYEWICFGM